MFEKLYETFHFTTSYVYVDQDWDTLFKLLIREGVSNAPQTRQDIAISRVAHQNANLLLKTMHTLITGS